MARVVVDAALTVHRALGPGLFESVCEAVMPRELEGRGLRYARQIAVPLIWDGLDCGTAFRMDLLVEDLVVVEIKSIDAVGPVHKKQVLTYLRLANKRLGLLINFNVDLLKYGITRLANNL